MSVKITKADILWSYVGYVLSNGVNLLILPFILRYLSKEELGLWYTFWAVNGLVMLLDFGFTTTIMRNVSFCWGGARSLLKEGLEEVAKHDGPNFALLEIVVQASRSIYLRIGLIALALLAVPGSFYVHSLTGELAPASRNTAWAAWAIFSVGVFCNLYYAYWGPMLRGIGAIKEINQAMALSKGVQLLVSLAGLLAGFGLMAPAAGFLLSGIATRMISRRSFLAYDGLGAKLATAPAVPPGKVRETMAVIWHTASQQGIVLIGSFLIQRADLLVCSAILGLGVSAEYGLTQQLFASLTTVSVVLFHSYAPLMNAARLKNDRETLRKYFSLSLVVSWIILIAGSLVLAGAGQEVLLFLKSTVGHSASSVDLKKTAGLLPAAQILFFGLFLMLEVNHSLFYALIMTGNRIPKPGVYIATGVAIVVLDVLLLKLALARHLPPSACIWGLLLSHCLCQLAYNNWKWPVVGLKELDLTFFGALRLGSRALSEQLLRRFRRRPA